MHTHINPRTHTHTHMHACIHTHTHTHAHTHTHMHAYIRTCYIRACMHAYTHTHTRMHAYIYAAYVHTCMHTYTDLGLSFPQVFDIEDVGGVGTAVAARPRSCSMCRECIREPQWDERVKLSRVKDHFIFSIE